MEIVYISDNALRLKTKTALLGVFHKDEKEKNTLDAVLSFDKASFNTDVVTFNSPGDFEVKGIKIEGEGKDVLRGFSSKIESMQIFIGQASTLGDTKDLPESDVAIIRADVMMDLKPIANLGAHLVALCGPEASKVAHQLQPNAQSVNKIVISKDKLADDMQIIVME